MGINEQINYISNKIQPLWIDLIDEITDNIISSDNNYYYPLRNSILLKEIFEDIQENKIEQDIIISYLKNSLSCDNDFIKSIKTSKNHIKISIDNKFNIIFNGLDLDLKEDIL